MEVIIDNEFYKRVRLDYGLIVNIEKVDKGMNIYHKINTRKDLKKLAENIYELKNDLTFGERVSYKDSEDTIYFYPKGTKLIKEGSCSFYVINSIKQEEEYFYEVKIAGGTLCGDKESILSELKLIQNQIEDKRVDN